MYTTTWLTVIGTRMHTTWLNTIGTRMRVKLVQESDCSDDTWLNTIGHRPGNDDRDDFGEGEIASARHAGGFQVNLDGDSLRTSE